MTKQHKCESVTMSEKKYQYLISFRTNERVGDYFVSSKNKNLTRKDINEIREIIKKTQQINIGAVVINNIINLGYMTDEEFNGESND